jgi:hypothetical protein
VVNPTPLILHRLPFTATIFVFLFIYTKYDIISNSYMQIIAKVWQFFSHNNYVVEAKRASCFLLLDEEEDGSCAKRGRLNGRVFRQGSSCDGGKIKNISCLTDAFPGSLGAWSL